MGSVGTANVGMTMDPEIQFQLLETFVNTKHCRCEREGEEETSNGKMGKLLFV